MSGLSDLFDSDKDFKDEVNQEGLAKALHVVLKWLVDNGTAESAADVKRFLAHLADSPDEQQFLSVAAGVADLVPLMEQQAQPTNLSDFRAHVQDFSTKLRATLQARRLAQCEEPAMHQSLQKYMKCLKPFVEECSGLLSQKVLEIMNELTSDLHRKVNVLGQMARGGAKGKAWGESQKPPECI